MNQKQIGIILIIVGVVLAGFVYVVMVRENNNMRLLMEAQGGSCFLDDGTCLHADREIALYVFGWAFSLVLIVFGVFIGFVDKTQEKLLKHQSEVARELHKAKREDRVKDEFKAFLAGFNENEQKVLKAVKEQDGIKQSTLRYRTGISKTGLSLMLAGFEKKGIVSRKKSGKTNEVFLQKKF